MNIEALLEINPEIAKIEGYELIEHGFIRVTGLKFYGPGMPWDGVEIVPTVKNLGTWGTNNGTVVIITEKGEVWIGFGKNPRDFDDLKELTWRLCPQGGDHGMRTVCCVIPTGAERIPQHQLLARNSTPCCGLES